MVKRTSKEGFTLIELSLAMVFISLLSLAIVLIIMNTVSSYRKGITLSKVNSTGSELVDDMRTAVQNSSATSLDALCASRYQGATGSSTAEEKCKNDHAQNFISVVWSGNVKLADAKEITDVPLFGAFCSGSYSYIWNSGYFFMKDGTTVTVTGTMADDASAGGAIHLWFGSSRPAGSARLLYKNASNEIVDAAGFRLLKIKDESRQVCVGKTSGGSACRYDPFGANGDAACPTESVHSVKTNVFDITDSANMQVIDDPVDLLSESKDGSLALYDLSAVAPATSASGGGDSFLAASFILGTVDGGPDIKASGSSCALPESSSAANFDYCAINRFNFAARASGE